MPSVRDRRALILDEAANLFARQGVAATTVREIADAVGILSGSLYHHFASKDEIVDAVVSGFLRDLRSRYDEVLQRESGAAERLRGLVLASLLTVADHPRATEIYQNDGHRLRASDGHAYVEQSVRAVRSAWVSVLEQGQADGTFRDDVPVKVVYPLLRDGLWQTARWFKPTRGYGHAQLAEDYLTLFLHGLERS
ncbi:MAG TPA: TetR/AcrR family transcriptional regulator [Mycobacteriales bacterium]|nr:TetR/AcrR family transcriptional regulator [Mycobacteriales bacterium]